jgi:MAF protein
MELVRRLARQKAEALAGSHPGHLIIGSDQVAVLGEQVLGKPHTFERACEQLLECSGQQVSFLTGLALLNSATGHCQVDCVPFTVTLRELDRERVERYVAAEQPLDCAGSFKCEGLGISLFEAIDNSDPSALIGLPLIALARLLREAGIALP